MKITLLYKIYPVQDFPGNNLPLYFYPFNTLVFRLNRKCKKFKVENDFVTA